MKYIAVFCGSSSGNNPIFAEQAELLGNIIVEKGYGLVYGGANVGLMGAVADGAINKCGKVIGVLPDFMRQKELEHKGLSELHIVTTMHERKAMMCKLSDIIITLPGGWGTMEELFEMLTWGQLNLHNKAIGLLNVDGYYDSLINMVETMIEKGFLKEEYRNMFLIANNVYELLSKIESYTPPANGKWHETK